MTLRVRSPGLTPEFDIFSSKYGMKGADKSLATESFSYLLYVKMVEGAEGGSPICCGNNAEKVGYVGQNRLARLNPYTAIRDMSWA